MLLDGDLCIIFDAYRCAVDASAGNAIRSSADASRCSESYLPLRHDCRRRMMFERCLAMFRKLVDHFNAPVVRVIALRLFPGSHVQEHKSARARRCSSAKVSDTKFLKTNGRQSEGGADAPDAAVSAIRTVINARMQLARISVEAIRHVCDRIP
ncbi:hypothetical protein [Xanthomonas phaseoli]